MVRADPPGRAHLTRLSYAQSCQARSGQGYPAHRPSGPQRRRKPVSSLRAPLDSMESTHTQLMPWRRIPQKPETSGIPDGCSASSAHVRSQPLRRTHTGRKHACLPASIVPERQGRPRRWPASSMVRYHTIPLGKPSMVCQQTIPAAPVSFN